LLVWLLCFDAQNYDDANGQLPSILHYRRNSKVGGVSGRDFQGGFNYPHDAVYNDRGLFHTDC